MTSRDDLPVSGAARARARFNRIVRFVAFAMGIAIVAGAVTGFAATLVEDGAISPWIIVAGWAIGVAGFVWFTVAYFRKVDELDVLDNLWSSLIGLYFYIVAFPSWWMFHEIGLVPEPDAWVIYIATFAITILAYLARKVGLR